jgi:glucose/arabinose dehydrogenase
MEKYPSLFIIIFVAYLTALLCSGQMYSSITQFNDTSLPDIKLNLLAQGFAAPIQISSPNDGTGRMFTVDQAGLIEVITDNGTLLKEPFLDIRSKIVKLDPSYDERGLLGMALHHDFKNNGRIFVYYSATLRPGAPPNWDHTDRISEFKVSKEDPNRADPASERIILEIDHPEPNNNGGSILFGPDGYLYIPIGDGGGSDDVGIGHSPEGNAQNLSNLLGKILRIDIDNASIDKLYNIPTDNPFPGNKTAKPEIFAYGFRSPSISFDADGNNSLFASDPGQMRWEEVDMVIKGGNYGWNIKEGSHCFNIQDRSIPITSCRSTGYLGETLIDPFIEYSYDLGQPVINGYIYRGMALPMLYESYVLGYRSTSYNKPDGGLMVAAPKPTGKEWIAKGLKIDGGHIGAYVLSIGERSDLELYVMTSRMPGPAGSTGRIYRIDPSNTST